LPDTLGKELKVGGKKGFSKWPKMKLKSKLNGLSMFSRSLSRWFEWAGIAAILLIILMTVLDVIGGRLLKLPMPASTEIVGFLQLIAIASCIAFTQIIGGHIRLEAFVNRLPKWPQAIVNCIGSFFSLVLFLAITWQSYFYGEWLRSAGVVTASAKIPIFFFAYFIGVCSAVVCLVFLSQFFNYLDKAVKE